MAHFRPLPCPISVPSLAPFPSPFCPISIPLSRRISVPLPTPFLSASHPISTPLLAPLPPAIPSFLRLSFPLRRWHLHTTIPIPSPPPLLLPPSSLFLSLSLSSLPDLHSACLVPGAPQQRAPLSPRLSLSSGAYTRSPQSDPPRLLLVVRPCVRPECPFPASGRLPACRGGGCCLMPAGASPRSARGPCHRHAAHLRLRPDLPVLAAAAALTARLALHGGVPQDGRQGQGAEAVAAAGGGARHQRPRGVPGHRQRLRAPGEGLQQGGLRGVQRRHLPAHAARPSPQLLPGQPLGLQPGPAGHQQGPARRAQRPRHPHALRRRAPDDQLPPLHRPGHWRRGHHAGQELLGLLRGPQLLPGQGGRGAGEQAAGVVPGAAGRGEPQVRP